MDKKQIKAERLRILKEETALYMRLEAGENVTMELRHCGKRLENLGRLTERRDILDESKPGVRKDETLISPDLEEQGSHNGVSRQLMLYRLRLGWSEERAATTPVAKRTRAADLPITIESYRALSNSGLSDVKIAEKVGITNMQLNRFKKNNGLTNKKGVTV